MSLRKKPSKELQGKIRRRARFTCDAEETGKVVLAQLAHIIPDSDGSDITLDNLLWLCESCHRKYEVEGKSGLIRDTLIENLNRFRDRPKLDSLVDGLFNELQAHPDLPITVQIGTATLVDVVKVFSEPDESYRPSFLKFYRDGFQLRLEGRLKDINGFSLIEFDGKNMHFHTRDVWDLERRARYLKIYNKTKDIWIEIKQSNDLTVLIEGNLYAGGGVISFDRHSIHFPGNNNMSNLFLEQAHVGLGLPASPLPRPYGHTHPNVP